jgi:tRNA threonylcarbamoyl adenosine modification protein YeaZ
VKHERKAANIELKILAIEQSTARSSAALLEDTDVIAGIQWEADRSRNQQLFKRLPELLDAAGIAVAGIDAFAVGTGPGSFAGVRSAIATTQAMAMPDLKPVIGVGSTETMARAVLQSKAGADHIVIVGDARRKRLWFADLAVKNGSPTPNGEVVLIDPAELPDRLCEGTVLASPDWHRIGDIIRELQVPGICIQEGPVTPEARTLGIIATERIDQNSPLPPPVPVYLHPPVFVEPATAVRPQALE